jgi:hypothetical protein
MLPPQSCPVANANADGNRFNISNLAYYLKIHRMFGVQPLGGFE